MGEYHSLESRGLALWKRFGPWAPRRLSALHYATSFGTLSSAWCWAAVSLPARAPGPLARPPTADADLRAHAPAPKPASPPPTADKAVGVTSVCAVDTSSCSPSPASSDSAPVNLSFGVKSSPGAGVARPEQGPPCALARAPQSGGPFRSNGCAGFEPRDKSERAKTQDA